jgi:hypothetical protein
MYGGVLFAVMLLAAYRLHRRLVFELDARQLVVRSSLPWLAGTRAWPRERMADIRVNRSNGKLLVHVTGQGFVDIYASANREVTQHVADVLVQALRTPPAETALETVIERPPRRRASRFARAAGVVAFATMFAASLALMFAGSIWAVPGVYLMLFSVVPLGIAFGTQEKEFYI